MIKATLFTYIYIYFAQKPNETQLRHKTENICCLV